MAFNMDLIFKKLFCRHNYDKAYGWSYMECCKCGKIHYDPKNASMWWAEYFQTHYKGTQYMNNQVRFELNRRGILKFNKDI